MPSGGIILKRAGEYSKSRSRYGDAPLVIRTIEQSLPKTLGSNSNPWEIVLVRGNHTHESHILVIESSLDRVVAK
jgi:hypothetical protein